MATVRDCSQGQLFELKKTLSRQGQQKPHMHGAAQGCMDAIYEAFDESLVLARIFATARYRQLPQADRLFLRGMTESQNLQSQLTDDSIVLSLLGTRGAKEPWNDRRRSSGHLGIPLLSSEFVEGIPMISKLMIDMGIGLEWIDDQETDIIVRALGKIVRVFHVQEAATAKDAKGRHIVAAQDFVAENGVKTVFGFGGSYLDGTFLTAIFFSREELDRLEVEKFLILFSAIKNTLVEYSLAGTIYG